MFSKVLRWFKKSSGKVSPTGNAPSEPQSFPRTPETAGCCFLGRRRTCWGPTEDRAPEPLTTQPHSGPKPAPRRRFFRFLKCFRKSSGKVSPTGNAPSEPQSFPRTPETAGCCFRGKRRTCCGPTEDRAPEPLTTQPHSGPKPAPRRRFFRFLKCCKSANKVTLSPVSCSGSTSVKQRESKSGSKVIQSKQDPSRKGLDLARCGLPNIGNSCYMNASIQALRTIKPFMLTLSGQENVWANCNEAELLRHLKALADVTYSSEHVDMTALAWSFKVAVAQKAPMFGDFQQQDAHEFLMALMDQIQSFASILDVFAFSLEIAYVCPVKEHMMFQMENTRTCKRCAQGSSQMEDFTVISLDLSSGLSIRKLLARHLRETELEYRCECGGTFSRQTTCIATLPNILILHLKRFRYNSKFRMKKVMHRIQLDEDLVIQSKQGAGCFKLASIISHLGHSVDHGHYICDGLGPEDSPQQPRGTWLTYDDHHVTKTSLQDICRKRTRSAYILFYELQTPASFHCSTPQQ